MKHNLFLFIGISLFINLSAQDKPRGTRPKGMSFMPEGTFVNYTKTPDNTIYVSAFWVGNEVTNAEYAEFIEYANAHPNEELKLVNLENPSTHKYGNLRPKVIGMNEYISIIKYSEIRNYLIDFEKLPHEDYLYNKKYATYPVVGISNKAAQWYCAWKTEMEVKKGKSSVYRYRLQTEDEWIYMASQIKTIHKDYNPKKVVPSQKGKVDIRKLHHLLDNVSEWTSTNTYKNNTLQKVVKGGSWFGNQGIFESKSFEENTAKRYIGFRVVRAYMRKE